MAANKVVSAQSSETIEAQITTLLEQMTLAEKIGQMTQVEKNSITPSDVTQYAIGSVLSGGGGNPTPNTPRHWAEMVKAFAEAALESRLAIPLIYGVDGVHGHNNVKGAVIFPHNIGLGATRDPELVERIAQTTAKELLATNVHWDFAPAVSVPQDIRWGRTYEGFSENTDVVTQLGVAYIRGLQKPVLDGQWVLPSVKHFVGDGGTSWGTTGRRNWAMSANWQASTDAYQIDQGDAQIDEDILREIHLAPYQAAIEAGALNIMVSFSSWNGQKMHQHHYLLTDVLKGEMGFEGFLVTDWMAINHLSPDYYVCVVESINAGVDMVMVPFDYKAFISTLTEAVEKGDVSQARIDDAVRRILYAKFRLGLFDKPLNDEKLLNDFGSEQHREVAREGVRKSLVLLKNNNNVLPLVKDTSTIYVAGKGSDDIGLACGGWTISWLGGRGTITEGKTLLDGLKVRLANNVVYLKDGNFEDKAEVGIAVVAENPYSEGVGDREDLSLPDADKQLIRKMRQQCEKLILVLYSGRPLIITDIVEECDVIVAAWLPGSEADAIADVLTGDYPFVGKLPYTWPRSMKQVPLSALRNSDENPLWEFGFGL